MNRMIEGEVIDTYGGDFTYRDTRYAYEDGEYAFYETHYGVKPEAEFKIEDQKEIDEIMVDFFIYWEVNYISCEGNPRWGFAKTPFDWDSDMVRSNLAIGGMGDDISSITSIEPTQPADDVSWELTIEI